MSKAMRSPSNKPAIYRAVIDDVINNIKPEFEEFGVTEDVLADLQHVRLLLPVPFYYLTRTLRNGSARSSHPTLQISNCLTLHPTPIRHTLCTCCHIRITLLL
jgi:hypothetical protein